MQYCMTAHIQRCYAIVLFFFLCLCMLSALDMCFELYGIYVLCVQLM